MFIVDLKCSNEHEFEGWYENAQEYETIKADGDLTCPLCQSDDVMQVLSTGAIKTTKTASAQQRPTSNVNVNAPAEATPAPTLAQAQASPPPTMPLEMQKQLSKVVQWVRRTHEDVGGKFAETAIAIHRGEQQARPIRGESDQADEKRMSEEGVPFLKVPIPDIENN